jgi:hypothetical protein
MSAIHTNGKVPLGASSTSLHLFDPSTLLPAAPATTVRQRLDTIESSPAKAPTEVQIGSLYLAPEAGSVELRSAMTLLPDALEWLDRALDDVDSGDPVHADDAMQHVHGMLPELFCCRTLGDGFGAVVGALLEAFEHLRSLPMTAPQIRAVRRAMQTILSNPRMSFEKAMEQIDKIESSGLNIEPELADELAEVLQ